MTAQREHGTRAKYVHDGCKCPPCTQANRDYTRELNARNRLPWRLRFISTHRTWYLVNAETGEQRPDRFTDRGLALAARDELNAEQVRRGTHVPIWASADDIAEARTHLQNLRARGVGLRAAALAAGITRAKVQAVARGFQNRPDRPSRLRLKRATVEAILAVKASAVRDHAIIDAANTWRRLDELLAHGMTRGDIARVLGSTAKTPALQLGGRVTAAKARAVLALHDRTWADDPAFRLRCTCPR